MLPYQDRRLTPGERAADIVSRLTADEKIALLPTEQAAVPRLCIRKFSLGGEGAHGVVDREGKVSTVFPQPVALASTWDAPLLKKIGSVIGDEARVWYRQEGETSRIALWFPTVDLLRDPRWGRTEEGYGEDPFHTGMLASALIKGAQGDNPYYAKISCAPKHFYANNTEKNRAKYSAVITNRDKHEYYLRVFSYVFLEGGALSLMTAYNEINGRPCILLDELKTLVKGEWGCDGCIVCDGGDFSQTVTEHKYYKNNAQTIAGALRAGVDAFTDDAETIIKAAKKALKDNLISEADIDAAVFNTLKMRIKLGEFDKNHPYSNITDSALLNKKSADLSLKAAQEAIVLLKNDGFLPFKNKEKTFVAGDIAQTLYPGWYEGTAPFVSTVLDSLKEKNGEQNTIYDDLCDTVSFFNEEKGAYITVTEDGDLRCDARYEERAVFKEYNWGFGFCSYFELKTQKYLTVLRESPKASVEEPYKAKGVLKVTAKRVYGWFNMELFYSDTPTEYFIHEGSGAKWKKNYEELALPRVLKKASEASRVVLNFGNHPLINGRECVDRSDITLPERQTIFTREITKVNKNTVLLITAGYPYAIEEEADLCRAAVYTGQGSQSLGKAVAGCLFGEFSPAGRLSMTWYKSAKYLPPIDDYGIIGKRTYMYNDNGVLYPFGHGLSYSRFTYSDLNFRSALLDYPYCKNLTVSFTVTNDGAMPSDEVAQVYFKQDNGSRPRPLKQLCGFTRLSLKKGESKRVKINVNLDEFRFYDTASGKMIVETGDYTIFAGASSADLRLSGNIRVIAAKPGNRQGVVSALDYDNASNITHKEDIYRHTCAAQADAGLPARLEFDNFYFEDKKYAFTARFGAQSSGELKLYIGGNITAVLTAPKQARIVIPRLKQGRCPVSVELSRGCMLRDFFFESL